MRKPKTPETPETETPANDAADVVAEATRTFYQSGADSQLPDLPDSNDDRTGRLADVFHASGYWPNLTPAKIAVQILAGETLGLKPAAAMFDLRISSGDDGPTIRWTHGQPFAAVQDELDQRPPPSEFDNVINDDPDRTVIKTDIPGELKNGESVVLEFQTSAGAAKITKPDPDPDPFETPADIITRTDLLDKALDYAQNSAENGETAIPGVLSGQDEQTPGTSDDGPKIDPSPVSVEMPAESGPTTDAVPAADIATPETASGSSDLSAIGNVEIKAWRASIEKQFTELKFSPARVAESLKKYDVADIKEKGRLFEQASKYYQMELNTRRDRILKALKDDGKQTLDQMAGFFLFAGIGHNPDGWRIPDVDLGLAALAEFGIGSDPPPPPAA